VTSPAVRDEVARLIRAELDVRLTASHDAVLRRVPDLYRKIIGEAFLTENGDTGKAAQLRIAQRALDRIARIGVVDFVDQSGRRWQMQSYVEMAVRTAALRARTDAQMQVYRDRSISLVYVSNVAGQCGLCRPFESKALALDEVPTPDVVEDGDGQDVEIVGTVADAIAAGLMHPNCFPGDVLVSAPSGVRASDSRWYEGEIVVIHTAGGQELTVTPNHPVLTPEGWVAAGLLQVGGHVLRYDSGDEGADVVAPAVVVGPHDHQVPARISDVHDALRKASEMLPARVPVTAEQFHGDGRGGDVEVVLADSFLSDGLDADPVQLGGDGVLLGSGAALSAFLTESATHQVVVLSECAADGVVGGGDLSLTLCGRHALPLAALGFTSVSVVPAAEQYAADAGLAAPESPADLGLGDTFQVELDCFVDPLGVPSAGDSGGVESAIDDIDADPEVVGEFVDSLSGLVSADHVVNVKRRSFAGHVYNLQSGDGWYVANGILVHNCRHRLYPFRPGRTTVPPATPDPDAYADQQRLRAMEATLRQWRRREAAAMTPEARELAARKVADWQAEIRRHVAETGVRRLYGRESPDGPLVSPTPQQRG
jgi:hypothetical protein